MKLELQAGIRVETVGNDAIVLDRSGVTFHHAVGDAAEVLRRVTSGEGDIDLPSELLPAVAALTEAGVLVPTGLSRRNLLLKGGVGVAAAGLTSFALATPAAAASLCPGNVTPDGEKTFTSAETYIPAPGVTSVVVRAWGGGGGGGRGSSTTNMSVTTNNAGAGGGGGAFNQTTVAVTECVSYNVTYTNGTGGLGATMDSMAGDPGVALTVTLNGTSVTANGGTGGAADGTAGAGGSAGLYVGGAGASQSGSTSGGGGGGAGSGGVGMAGSGASGGAGGSGTYLGGTGGAGGSGGSVGGNGTAPGGGGGGGGVVTGAPASGGNGAAGQAVIAVS